AAHPGAVAVDDLADRPGDGVEPLLRRRLRPPRPRRQHRVLACRHRDDGAVRAHERRLCGTRAEVGADELEPSSVLRTTAVAVLAATLRSGPGGRLREPASRALRDESYTHRDEASFGKGIAWPLPGSASSRASTTRDGRASAS